MTIALGALVPLHPRLGATAAVDYEFGAGTSRLSLATLLGRNLSITATGAATCIGCDAAFADLSERARFAGYCRRCWFGLPQCDRCFRAPEYCHFERGTCRDEAFGKRVCFSPHLVYLAETSAAKVGITRPERLPTRWLEQGAIAARIFATVESRRVAGEVEALLRTRIGDRTQWQAMLRRVVPSIDLAALADRLGEELAEELTALRLRFGPTSIRLATDASPSWTAHYPLLPNARVDSAIVVKGLRLRAAGERLVGCVIGAKGRYLLLDTGVFNTGAHDGMDVRIEEVTDEVVVAPGSTAPRQQDLF